MLADITRRRPRAWLALDDDAADWPEKYLDHLVLCDGALGLSKPETLAELSSKLARMFEELRNASR